MNRNLVSTFALVLVLPAVFLLASCSKKAMESEQAETPQAEMPAVENTNAGKDGSHVEVTAPEQVAAEFVNRNIYFEYDSAVLSDQAQEVLTEKAEYLRNNPELMVTVEGHCDERGTGAYNMALGDRRAKSAKGYLEYMGIGKDRLRTISYGEERPVAMNHDESSWSRNRRAQFVIK